MKTAPYNPTVSQRNAAHQAALPHAPRQARPRPSTARHSAAAPLAAVHLTGGDPYHFTALILAWAAGRAAAEDVQLAGALGPGRSLRSGRPRKHLR